MLIYILYGGESADGTGSGYFLKATESKEEALKHYKSIKSNPYSTGEVQVLTESSLDTIFSEQTELKYFGVMK